MNICPNTNLDSWKQLVDSVGEFEAYRVFISNNYEIPESNTTPTVDKVSKDIQTLFGENSEINVSDALENISQGSNAAMKVLAKRLLRNISNDTKIKLSTAQEVSDIVGKQEDFGGVFNSGTNTIHVRANQPVAVVLHEILHAFTYSQLKGNSQSKKELEQIHKYLKSIPKLEGEYAMQNLDEFLVGIFTDAKFITKLQSIPSKTNKNLSVWEDLMNVLAEVLTKLGFSKSKSKSILEESMDAAIRVIEDSKERVDNIENSDEQFDISELDSYPSLSQEEQDYYESLTMNKSQEKTVQSVLSIQNIGLNEGGTHYVHKDSLGKEIKDSIQYERVSSALGNTFSGDSSAYQINRDAGNEIDGLLSDVILGKSLEDSESTIILDEGVKEELYNYFSKFIKDVTKDGSVVMTQQIFSNETAAIAGATDVIVIKPSGKVDVYDLKTSIHSTIGDKYNTPYNAASKSTKAKHTEQQSMYKRLAELQGIKVDNLHILPVNITLEEGRVTEFTPEPIIKLEYNKRVAEGLVTGNKKATKTSTELVEKLEIIKRDLNKFIKIFEKRRNSAATDAELAKAKSLLENLNEKKGKLAVVQGLSDYIEFSKEAINVFSETMQDIKDDEDNLDNIGRLVSLNKFASVFNNVKDLQVLVANSDFKEKQDEQLAEWNQLRGVAISQGEEGDFLDNNPVPSQSWKSLDDAVAKLEALKKDYQEQGAPLLAKKLWSLMSEKDKETAKKFKDSLDSKKANSAIASEEELANYLKRAAKDLDGYDRALYSTAGSTDPVLALMTKLIVDSQTEVTEKLMQDSATLGKAFEKFTKGKSKDNVAKLNSALLDTYTVKEKDENDNVVEKTYYKFVEEYNTEEYKQARRDFYDSVESLRTSDKKSDRAEYYALKDEWFAKNTKPMPQSQVDSIIAEKKANLSESQYENWENRNIEEDDKGVVYYKNELVLPADKYKSQKYKELQSNPQAKEYYDSIMSLHEELLSSLPYGKRQQMKGKMPFVYNSSFWDRVQSQGLAGAKKSIKDSLNVHAGDINYGLTDTTGKSYKELPLHYMRPIESKDASVDILTNMLAFATTVRKYEAKAKILDEINIAEDIIANQKVDETNSLGQSIIDKGNGAIDNIRKKEGESNIQARFKSMLASNYYGAEDANQTIEWFGKEISLDKLAGNLGLVTSVVGLGGNIISGISNAANGKFQNWIEAAAGKFFSKKTMGKAEVMTVAHIPQSLRDIGKLHNKSYLTQLSELFNFSNGDYVGGLADNKSGSFAKRNTGIDNAFVFMKGGEHQIAMSSGLSFLLDTRLVDGQFVQRAKYLGDKSGKELEQAETKFDKLETSLVDAYEIKENGIIGLKKEYKDSFSNAELRDMRMLINGVNEKIQGNYSSETKAEIQRMWWGKLAMMYRKHVAPGLQRRFGKKNFNFGTGEVEEGSYSSTAKVVYNFFKNVIKETKEVGFFEAISNNNTLTTSQKQNMKRMVYEVSLGFIMMSIVSMIGGDDDEKNTWAENFLALEARRLQGELLFYINPMETLRIMRSPAVSMSTVESFAKFAGGFLFVYGDEENYQRDSGVHKKGDSKDWARLKKLIPFLKAFEDIQQPEELIKTFNRGL